MTSPDSQATAARPCCVPRRWRSPRRRRGQPGGGPTCGCGGRPARPLQGASRDEPVGHQGMLGDSRHRHLCPRPTSTASTTARPLVTAVAACSRHRRSCGGGRLPRHVARSSCPASHRGSRHAHHRVCHRTLTRSPAEVASRTLTAGRCLTLPMTPHFMKYQCAPRPNDVRSPGKCRLTLLTRRPNRKHTATELRAWLADACFCARGLGR